MGGTRLGCGRLRAGRSFARSVPEPDLPPPGDATPHTRGAALAEYPQHADTDNATSTRAQVWIDADNGLRSKTTVSQEKTLSAIRPRPYTRALSPDLVLPRHIVRL